MDKASVIRLAVALLLFVTMELRIVSGHGRLLEPPSRSSMWRSGFNTTRNYDDNALNCGGLYTLWYVNQGKCGVCGDPWNQPAPRDNEAGGKYGRGIITRSYTPGQEINIRVEITANHRGWFEFRLCPHNDPTTPITQQCLDQHLLELADGSGTRYQLGSGLQYADLTLKLPAGVICSQCVLQWKWHAANNFGTDSNGKSCIGCGPIQEEFYSCSDIAIGDSAHVSSSPARPGTHGQQISGVTYQTVKPTQFFTYPPFKPLTASARYPVVTGTNLPVNPVTRPTQPAVVTYPPFNHITNPAQTYPPFPPITFTPGPHTETYPPFQPISFSPVSPTNAPTLTKDWLSGSRCQAISSWKGNPQLERYCSEQCPLGNCPTQFCSCSKTGIPTTGTVHTAYSAVPHIQSSTTVSPRLTTAPHTPNTVISPTVQVAPHCYGINSWQGIPRLDKWCDENCAIGLCPTQNCRCSLTSAAQRTTGAPASPTTVHQPSSIHTSSTVVQCHATGLWAGQAQLDQWCMQTCNQYMCNLQYCSCSPITADPSTVNSGPVATTATVCFAVNGWAGVKQLDDWCNSKCHSGTCPPDFCACRPAASGSVPTIPLMPSVAPVTTDRSTIPPTNSQSNCHAVSNGQASPALDRWCQEECPRGNCSPVYCRCDP